MKGCGGKNLSESHKNLQKLQGQSGLLTKTPKLNGYFKVAGPEVKTPVNPPAAVTAAEPT